MGERGQERVGEGRSSFLFLPPLLSSSSSLFLPSPWRVREGGERGRGLGRRERGREREGGGRGERAREGYITFCRET